MKKIKMATLYLRRFDDEGEDLIIYWHKPTNLTDRLGMLEWAKAGVLEQVKDENALASYHEAER